MGIKANAILFECTNCHEKAVYSKLNPDGHNCQKCGGPLIPQHEIYAGFDLLHGFNAQQIQKIIVKPDETLIVSTDCIYTANNRGIIEKELSNKIGCKVQVLDRGMKANAVIKAE